MIKRAMEKNGSPAPIFETDDERTFFQVTLKIHPDFKQGAVLIKGIRDTINANEGANHNPEVAKANVEANEGANEGANAITSLMITEDYIDDLIDNVNNRVKPKLTRVYNAIASNQNKRVPDYVAATGINAKGVERYIKILKDAGIIDFTEGSTKLGGYFITNKMKHILANKND